MKIAMLSDLHLDTHAKRHHRSLVGVTSEVSQALDTLDFDLLALAGDLSNDCRLTKQIADQLRQELGRPVYYIPGNHDFYNIDNQWETNDILQFFQEDEYCLFARRLRLEDGGDIVGHTGWYDYSYGSPTYTLQQYETKTLGMGRWRDGDYIDWGMSDQDFCAKVHETIDDLIDPDNRDRTLLVTHMINHPKFTVTAPVDSRWDFFNAYLGSRELYHYLTQNPIRAALCGHVHYRFNFVWLGMAYYCNCLGRMSEWPKISLDVPLTLKDQVLDATEVLDL